MTVRVELSPGLATYKHSVTSYLLKPCLNAVNVELRHCNVMGGDVLWLGSKGRYGSRVGGR